MYERVKEWVYDRGGRLMYLGGNGINCEVEFLDDATLHFKSQLLAEGGKLGMVDPNDPAIYYDSRFHRTVEPEASLLGVATTAEGIMTAAPYRVRDAAHWVFAGTGLKNGDLFGEASLHERVHGGASGHETDKMTPSSPPNTTLLAKGTNPDEGGAEMVTYETGSGGAVFSVGSITYPSSLLVDANVSRITANVINRFLEGRADEDHGD
jgi:N,N-dimethylformamidase